MSAQHTVVLGLLMWTAAAGVYSSLPKIGQPGSTHTQRWTHSSNIRQLLYTVLCCLHVPGALHAEIYNVVHPKMHVGVALFASTLVQSARGASSSYYKTRHQRNAYSYSLVFNTGTACIPNLVSLRRGSSSLSNKLAEAALCVPKHLFNCARSLLGHQVTRRADRSRKPSSPSTTVLPYGR